MLKSSIADPDPNRIRMLLGLLGPDPDSEQANIVRKTMNPIVLGLLFDFLSLKKNVNVPLKSYKQKNFLKKY
jgi:hypothetical protein